MRTIPVILCWLALFASAQAKLNFESTVLERQAEIGDDSVVAEFKFTNTGKASTEITRIDSSCGCLKAESDKDTYQPGESGTINVEFFVKGLTGTVEKSVSVETAGRDLPFQLIVKVTIPEILSIEPKMATWDLGEEPTTKRVTFKVLRSKPIHVLKVVPSRKNVTATLHTVEDGRLYEIKLTPTDTSDTMLGVVRIETDCEIREQQRQMTFFRIAKED